jgi:hypothetical protein
MIKLWPLLVLVGCGGPAFTNAEEGLAEKTDAAPADDAASSADAAPTADAAITDAAPDAAEMDAASPPDAGAVDASPIDSSPAADTAPTCTPIPPHSSTCATTGGAFNLTVTEQYCDSNGAQTTPDACRDCVEHYTCACIIAAGGFVCDGGTPLDCLMDNTIPTFGCN